jgi:hypothetical protein
MDEKYMVITWSVDSSIGLELLDCAGTWLSDAASGRQ